MEKLKLASKMFIETGVDAFAISLVILDWKDQCGVRIDFSEIDESNDDQFIPNGKRIEKNLRGDEAAKFLYWLSTSDFTKVSLKEAVSNFFLETEALPAAVLTGKPVDPMIAIQAKIDAAEKPVIVPAETENPIKP
jgi:hypothetical protein